MSRLTERISYLRGLAEGMKLNPEKDSHRLILGILEVLGDVGESYEALAEAHNELSEYVENIDQDLADVEADLYDDENEDEAEADGEEGSEPFVEYECPHCGQMIEFDTETMDLEAGETCPNCGKPLFPELKNESSADGKAEEDSAGDAEKPE